MLTSPTLISHQLCPYAQRVAISLIEKNIKYERVNIDLANKPSWFVSLSPLGKVPVLIVNDKENKVSLFESVAIVEYLEDVYAPKLHPNNALTRAEHRSWVEFGSSMLNDIGGFYSARDSESFTQKIKTLKEKCNIIESKLGNGKYFEGEFFSLVDTVFGPIFRYFDVFDQIDDFGIFDGCSKLLVWRKTLAERKSVQAAVTKDYNVLLTSFLRAKGSYLSSLIA